MDISIYFMRLFICLFALAVFVSCDNSDKKKAEKRAKRDDLVVSKYSDGSVRAEIAMKNGKKNGLAREYYQSGKVYREIEYRDGKKEGVAKRYYENGQLAQETFYNNDKINGTQKKYREDGKPASVAKYVEDNPCKGLVEYFTDGKVKDNYPRIVVTPEDRVNSAGLYILHISLSEKVKEVEYFVGKLTKENTIDSSSKKIWNTDKNGVASIEYPVMPGTFIMDKIHLIAKIKTPLENYYITERDYNVAAESR
jgi:antitoxin component YwqK of YwqJK toxin-antitoxin module